MKTENDREKAAVNKTIVDFLHAADARDLTQLQTILHPDFRVIANKVLGADKINILPKSSYLNLMEAGKIGGDKR